MFVPVFGVWTAVLAIGVVIVCILLLSPREKEVLPASARIVGDADSVLLPACTLEDGKSIIDESLKGLNHDQWRKLASDYSPWLVHACKTALKKAAKHPTTERPLEETDYISATVMMQQLVAYASIQLGEPEKCAEPSRVPEKKGLPIKQMTLTNDNTNSIIEELRKGQRMLIINISNVENEQDLKRSLKLIKRTAEAQEGGVIGLGTDWVVATHAIPITTQGGVPHGTV